MGDSARKKIMVALDGSERALRTVRYVSRMVPSEQVEVVLLHVMTKVPESFLDLEATPAYHYQLVDLSAWEAQQEKAVHAFMEKARKTLVDAGVPESSVTLSVKARKAGVSEDILAESRSGYNAIAVGRKGLSELKDLVLGTTANKLIEKVVHIPIWVVGGERQNGRILIPVDASEGAMQAVAYVADFLEGSRDFTVTLLHVAKGAETARQASEGALEPGGEPGWPKPGTEGKAGGAAVEPFFEKAREGFAKSGMPADRVQCKILKSTDRPGAIMEEAVRGEYDTIVVGRRGLSRVEEFFMGRVSNKVLHLAKDRTVWVVS